MPPIKLYKLNETHISLTKSDLVEKIGGDMVCVCWPNGDFRNPYFHSSSCAHEDGPLTEAKARISAQLNFKSIRTDLCFSSYTMTFQYDDDQIYLVHVRHLPSFYEYDEDELDVTADKIFADRPVRIVCDGWKTISETLKQDRKFYLLRDPKTGERGKVFLQVTRPKLVATLRWKYLIPYWLSGDHHHISLQFPGAKEKYEQFDRLISTKVGYLKATAYRWSMLNLTPKGLVDSLLHSEVPKWAVRIIVKMCKVHPERWSGLAVEEFHKMSAKKLIDILSLTDP